MSGLILSMVLATFLIGIALQRIAVAVSFKTKFLAIPTQRKRHNQPMPILGGITIQITWVIALCIFFYFHRSAYENEQLTLFYFAGTTGLLTLMGLIDDRIGIDPKVKLIVQFTAASIIMFEPNINSFLMGWEGRLGFFVWPLAVIWIVGVTNAMNLIDGVDGLLGGGHPSRSRHRL